MNSDDLRSQWADRTGEYSPEYYAYYGPNETSELLSETFAARLDDDARILELGCSAGRHLACLHETGFRNLYGVEINDDAREVMSEHYPDLAADATVRYEAIQDALQAFEDDAFDAIYSVETLQHIPPEDEWVYDEIARVAGTLLVTVETEEPSPGAEPDRPGVNLVNDEFPLYYRDWDAVFAERGFETVEVTERERDVVRVLRTADRVDADHAHTLE